MEHVEYFPPVNLAQFDFSDPFTVQAQPAAAIGTNRRECFEHPIFLAMRDAGGYEPTIVQVPNGSNVDIDKLATFEGRFLLPPGSFIWGVSAIGTQAEGFTFQISNLATGAKLFSTPAKSAHLTNSVTSAGQTWSNPVMLVLDKPMAVPGNGLCSIRITNLSTAQNSVSVVVYAVQPRPDIADARNAATDELAREVVRMQSIQRPAGPTDAGGSFTGPAGTFQPSPLLNPLNDIPAGSRPLVSRAYVACPAAGVTDFAIVSVTVPPGYGCCITGLAHGYTGPGFQEGSGDLVWRLQVDGAAQTNDFATSLGGDASYKLPCGILAASGQTITYTVSVAAGAPAFGSNVFAGIDGYFYPQQ